MKTLKNFLLISSISFTSCSNTNYTVDQQNLINLNDTISDESLVLEDKLLLLTNNKNLSDSVIIDSLCYYEDYYTNLLIKLTSQKIKLKENVYFIRSNLLEITSNNQMYLESDINYIQTLKYKYKFKILHE